MGAEGLAGPNIAEVLNAYVQAGDRIAYPTRAGSDMHMVIGTVVEVVPYTAQVWDSEVRKRLPRTVHKLRVRVEGYTRDVWLTELYRVVKIS